MAELASAQARFDEIEGRYFAQKANPVELREAWQARERAYRALALAQLARVR